MNTIIRTLPQLRQTQNEAWIYGMIVVGVALALAFLVSIMINWRSNRRDFMYRRIWFIILGLVFPVAYWIYNTEAVVPKIQNSGFQNMFKTTNLYVLFGSIIVYTAVGLLLMFCFRNSKFGSILGKKRN